MTTLVLRAKLAQLIFDTPLLMHPGKAVAGVSAIGGRVIDGGVVFDGSIEAVDHVAMAGGRPSAGRVGDPLGRFLDSRGVVPFSIVDGVAVIPIEGTLVHKGGYVGMSSGETSYEGLQTQIARARRSDAVRGVVFEVDSFGGQVAGAFETAAMIARLSEEKPTMAVLTDYALSAGYLLASAARQIVMPEHGRAGSIGVIALHADYSGMLAQRGVKVTILNAGARKADGNPYEALPDAVAERWRADLEAIRSTFAETVARHRGDRFSVEQALETEADDYGGAAAVQRGLVDAVGPAIEAFDAFVAAVNR